MVQDRLSVIGGVIECVWEAVKYLVASEPSLIQFSEIAKQLQLPSKKLILDCPTRWNSAYLMLSAALEFKDVFPRYSERDLGFAYMPSYEEWEKVERVCQFLEIFNDVTNIISGSEYPTSNLFLTEVWRIKEILDKSIEDSDDCVRLMAIRMKLKFDKYWGESNLLMGLGTILDPRYKMVLPGFCFPVIDNDPLQKVSQLKDNLYELYNEYVVMHSRAYNELISQQSTLTGAGSLNSALLGRKVVIGRSKYESFVRQSDSIQPVKDLDIYLEEGVYICQQGMDSQFDALEWWKANSLK
ncbi:zinc finger BED domain-containing protein RICESLEEPER 1-like [Rhododendron vialii]|uniref:zinc finger BED domain-containing protein RICESLEEPER 1-like n=1 Tax=Rhododendron vialii TaxID=182163 RepID=UPI00265FF835|nr:zinc finger BED domain-containing protein RICESLEEPER 1-like [Rhododendron vialii]